MSTWPKITLADAVEAARLTVTVIGDETKTLPVTRTQYLKLCRLFSWTGPLMNEREADPRPVEFDLAIMSKQDLGREGLTVDRVLQVSANYMGRSLEDTASDRKRFATRIGEASIKRGGGELDGGAGYGTRGRRRG